MTTLRHLAGALALTFALACSASAQQFRPAPFRAVHYDVEATLHPNDQTISASAKVEFAAREGSRQVLVELHPDLHVNSVVGTDGKPLPFERDADTPLTLKVILTQSAELGQHITLTFNYVGPLDNDEDSPAKGIRFGALNRNGAYLLLPARWFPLTDFPSNRYTATFKIIAPETFAVIGTGKSSAPTVVPPTAPGAAGQVAYTFTCDREEPVGTFVAGNLQLSPVRGEGMEVSVFTPPTQTGTAAAYGQSLARIVEFYSSEFGPLADPHLTVAQVPDGTVQGFSAPGLLLISARQWTPKGNDRLLAQLAAGQWWGDVVTPATPSDAWISAGLARYSEALYVEQLDSVAGMHRALEDFAVGALMYEDVAPIAQAQRLQPYSEEWRSVVVNKGAMVFHMLRSTMGKDAFAALLREFYAKYNGKPATVGDFERLTETKVPPPAADRPAFNATAFFSQWLNSTGIPEFKMDYIVYRTAKGFKVVGKVLQDLETFRMPVEVRVDTEGNPEYKSILITGISSPFEIDTFGRPKPGGITLDPNNNLLKSSPRLRVRAAVARGESMAEQGKFYEAIQEYQRALDIQPNNSLAHFRMGEAMFFQKNLQAAANAFRSALDGDLDPSYKWVEVWSHLYLGKIFDVTGQRERAVNEYSRAQQIGDDTGGAQAEATKYIGKPYQGDNAGQTSK